MIGFSVFLCKEKIAIIKRKREKGHVDLSSSTLEGKKKTENGTKRLIFTAVSILLEIVFLLFLFTKVSEYATIIDWATRIVAIFLVLGLYSMDKTSSMKMPWIILMLAFPILGVSLYLLVGLNGSTKKMRARYEEIDKKLLPYLPDNRQILEWMKEESPQAGAIASYLTNYSCYPVYQNTDVTYYDEAIKGLDAQLEDLSKAEKFIFMEYHAIEDEEAWQRIQTVLEDRVKAGVEVRIFYDDMGSIWFVNMDFATKLKSLGIKCRVFNPILPGLNMFLNNRDHRKITVIDGKVAFTGGVNLADEYINKKVRFGHWKDTAIKIEGDAVQSFTMMFLQMWNITERQPEDYAKYLTEKQPGFSRKDGYIIPYGDSPFDHENVGEEVYFHILNHAKKYVHIMTPYLILDNEMIDALTRAAKGGIEVQIIMPHIPDKPYAFYLAKTYYEELIAGGVEIYEYTPGFVHAKVFTSDDDTATVGSINLDYRSLYLHFECGVFIYRNPVVRDIEKDFQDTLAKCQKVTMTEVRNRSTFVKIYGHVLRLVAPLM